MPRSGFMGASGLSMMLANQGLLQPNDDAVKYTHLMLDGSFGGKAYVPARKMYEFLKKMATLLERGGPCLISEQRTETFWLYADLDVLRDSPINKETLANWVEVWQQVLSQCFEPPKDAEAEDGKWLTCIVLKSHPVQITDENNESFGKVKSGFHLHFPWIKVTSQQALSIREKVVCDLTAKFGHPRNGDNSFFDLVDERVYTYCGIRMMGNDKCKPCLNCRRKGGGAILACAVCDDVGKIMLPNRQYKLYTVLRPDSEHGIVEDDILFDWLSESILRVLLLTSIRYYDQSVPELARREVPPMWVGAAAGEWRPPAGLLPSPAQIEGKVNERALPIRKEDIAMMASLENGDYRQDVMSDAMFELIQGKSKKRDKLVSSRIRDVILLQIQDILRAIRPEWSVFFFLACVLVGGYLYNIRRSGLVVQNRMKHNETGSKLIVPVAGLGSNWCMNKAGPHTSHRIYFVLDKRLQVHQRCFCDCDRIRPRGAGRMTCKKFVSKSLCKVPFGVARPLGWNAYPERLLPPVAAAPAPLDGSHMPNKVAVQEMQNVRTAMTWLSAHAAYLTTL